MVIIVNYFDVYANWDRFPLMLPPSVKHRVDPEGTPPDSVSIQVCSLSWANHNEAGSQGGQPTQRCHHLTDYNQRLGAGRRCDWIEEIPAFPGLALLRLLEVTAVRIRNLPGAKRPYGLTGARVGTCFCGDCLASPMGGKVARRLIPVNPPFKPSSPSSSSSCSVTAFGTTQITSNCQTKGSNRAHI